MTLPTAKLADFCEIVQGGRLKLSGDHFVPDGYPAYGAGGLNGYLPVAEFHRPGIILSSIGARCGKCFLAEDEWTTLANTQVILPDLSRADVRFLWYQLNDESRWHRSGTAQPFIKPSDVKSHVVVLPPLPEQRRIAAILDQAEELRAKRRAAQDEVEALTASVFSEMFGDPWSNPMGFPVGALGDVATFVGGGTPSRAVPEYYTGPVCWATSKDMKARFLDDTQEHVTPAAVQASATKVVPAGTILVVVKSKILMHRLPVAISRVETCFGQDLKGIVVDETCVASYVATALQMNASWLLKRARGINTEGLTLDHLRRFPLLLPSKSKQQDFARFADRQEALRQRMAASIDKFDALFASLQHRAFRGEL